MNQRKQCIGYGSREGRCANHTGKSEGRGHRGGNPMWCLDCDAARLMILDDSFQRMRLPGNTPPPLPDLREALYVKESTP